MGDIYNFKSTVRGKRESLICPVTTAETNHQEPQAKCHLQVATLAAGRPRPKAATLVKDPQVGVLGELDRSFRRSMMTVEFAKVKSYSSRSKRYLMRRTKTWEYGSSAVVAK